MFAACVRLGHFKEFAWICIRKRGKASDVVVHVEKDLCDVAAKMLHHILMKRRDRRLKIGCLIST